jgi:non-ribosomal peptide synthetase component F
LSDGDVAITYRDLDRRANALAAGLVAAGAGPEDRVCVSLDRSIDLVVAILAVLKAGCAYVPIDPSYPSERVRYLLADSGAHIAVCDAASEAR